MLWETNGYAWFDDELVTEPVSREWCTGKRFRTVSPNPHTGLVIAEINNTIVHFRRLVD